MFGQLPLPYVCWLGAVVDGCCVEGVEEFDGVVVVGLDAALAMVMPNPRLRPTEPIAAPAIASGLSATLPPSCCSQAPDERSRCTGRPPRVSGTGQPSDKLGSCQESGPARSEPQTHDVVVLIGPGLAVTAI